MALSKPTTGPLHAERFDDHPRPAPSRRISRVAGPEAARGVDLSRRYQLLGRPAARQQGRGCGRHPPPARRLTSARPSRRGPLPADLIASHLISTPE